MISILKFLGVLGLLALVTAFLPTVTELPLGIDEAVVFFIGTIKALVNLIPFMQVPFTLILLAVSIRFALFVWHWVRWLVELI